MITRRSFLRSASAGGIAGIIASSSAPVFAANVRVKKSGVTLDAAQEVHDKCLIIDGHNDTPVERVARGKNVATMMQRDMDYQMDAPRMKEAGFDAGAFIVGNGLIADVWVTTEQTLSAIESYPKDLCLVLKADDAVRARKEGKVGVLMGIEGIAKWVMGEVDTLRMLHRSGVRLVGITHGEGGAEPEVTVSSNSIYRAVRKGPTFLQGSGSPVRLCTPEERAAELKNAKGLTDFGKEILRESNRLGMVTDLSHINDRAYFDVMELTSRPVIVSHTAAFSLCNHFRCLTDDQMKALARNGGVMGMIFAPQYLKAEQDAADVDTLVEHICYAVDLIGVDYVGIGSDYDGGVKRPVVPEMSQLVHITRSMLAHGLSETEIKKIWGDNFLRVLRATIG
jgi:membrane dipeptidase